MSLQECVERLQQAIHEGITSREELCRHGGCTLSALYSYNKKRFIHLPSLRGRRLKEQQKRETTLQSELDVKRGLTPKPDLDILIEQGLTARDMGTIIYRTRQLVDHYIRKSGQYPKWRELRELREEVMQEEELALNEERQHYLSLLEERISQVVTEFTPERRWAFQKAQEYIHSSKRRISIHHDPNYLKRLTELFERYQHARERNKKLSLEELGKGIKFEPRFVGRVLEAVNLESFYWHYDKRSGKFYAEKRKLLPRAFNVKLPVTDLAYFLRVSDLFYFKILRKRVKDQNIILLGYIVGVLLCLSV